jgi:hypothetical protein
MRDYIERLRSKPEHVRRRIALGATFGVTGIVTAVWFFGLLFGGSLSLGAPTASNGDTGTLASANSTDVSGNANSDSDSNVAGAAAANPFPASSVAPTSAPRSNFASLLAAMGINTAPKPAPALQIEDAAPSSTPSSSSGPTTIPF